SGQYTYNRQTISVTNEMPGAPKVSSVEFSGAVYRKSSHAFIGSFHENTAGTFSGAGCYGTTQKGGMVKDFVGAGATEAQIQAFLDDLTAEPNALDPLRNRDLEGFLAAKARKEAQDKADKEKAEQAEIDRRRKEYEDQQREEENRRREEQ